MLLSCSCCYLFFLSVLSLVGIERVLCFSDYDREVHVVVSAHAACLIILHFFNDTRHLCVIYLVCINLISTSLAAKLRVGTCVEVLARTSAHAPTGFAD